ncbi:hypothetical protein FB45DRAFT_878439 [Roridomyces roridus]|uniref:Uncharacterized protein n=1 Tax=Roridomyces roridus TaxID=1738132 RepID=A0AAD7B076_9AGAR|nr:hypothetical protein FB45DRAFT_878439 [Roridomyces roridus]
MWNKAETQSIFRDPNVPQDRNVKMVPKIRNYDSVATQTRSSKRMFPQQLFYNISPIRLLHLVRLQIVFKSVGFSLRACRVAVNKTRYHYGVPVRELKCTDSDRLWAFELAVSERAQGPVHSWSRPHHTYTRVSSSSIPSLRHPVFIRHRHPVARSSRQIRSFVYALPFMASALPSSWSSRNPFRPRDPWSEAYVPPPATPVYHHPPPTTPVFHEPRPYRPAPPPLHHGDGMYPSSDSSDEEGGAARHHSSVSHYVATAGPYIKPFSLNPGTWKAEDKLSLAHDNYATWSKHVHAHIGLQSGATRWLDPTELPPSFDMYPQASRIWHDNDMALHSYLQLTCDSSELPSIEECKTASAVWLVLHKRHTQRGPIHQVATLRETLIKSFFIEKYLAQVVGGDDIVSTSAGHMSGYFGLTQVQNADHMISS